MVVFLVIQPWRSVISARNMGEADVNGKKHNPCTIHVQSMETHVQLTGDFHWIFGFPQLRGLRQWRHVQLRGF